MQFVGLFTDGGEKIYEGYLVEIWDKKETKTPHTSKVTFGHSGTMIEAHPAHKALGVEYRNLEDYCDFGIGYKDSVTCKLVGNIYQKNKLLV